MENEKASLAQDAFQALAKIMKADDQPVHMRIEAARAILAFTVAPPSNPATLKATRAA